MIAFDITIRGACAADRRLPALGAAARAPGPRPHPVRRRLWLSRIGNILQIFGGLVLGCIEADFCKYIFSYSEGKWIWAVGLLCSAVGMDYDNQY